MVEIFPENPIAAGKTKGADDATPEAASLGRLPQGTMVQ